jgi:murein DD-endopeptidase
LNFYRPVGLDVPILAHFAEWGPRWEYKIDPDNGLWTPKSTQLRSMGQHRGVDFDCAIGTIVHAMADGMVVKSRYESSVDDRQGAGLYLVQIVEMYGYDAWWIRYSHLRIVYVELGERIKRGQPLGESGESGEIERPLLHVDLADRGVPAQYHPIPW